MSSAASLSPLTADALGQAMAAARAGDMVRARRVAEDALVRGGDRGPLNAFLGMIRARAGDLPGAIGHLRAAHAATPNDITIACNLIAAQIDAGDLTGALDVARRDLAFADPSLRLARYRGFLAQAAERFADAAEAYDHVVARAPGDFASWNNLGNARVALGEFAAGVAALDRAVALDPASAPTRINLAAALASAGRAADAEAVLRRAAADFPGDPLPLHDLHVLLKGLGRGEEAIDAIAQAAARAPGDAGLQLLFAGEASQALRRDDAERAYRAAIAADPSLREGYLGLAVHYEHANREDQFAGLIALAEANGLDEAPLNFIRALEHRRAKRFAEGLETLERAGAVEPERTLHLRATLLDRLGQSDAAFAAFEQVNRLHAADPSDPLARAAELRAKVCEELALLTPQWVERWRAADSAAPRPDPVFLVGFPRSGTTLLDTILMGHPDTVVLEERPPLSNVDKWLGGLAALPDLDGDAVAAARARYYADVATFEALPDGRMLIDKSPMFLLKAPLIRRLFPRARFILALRHPCDVLLSCFMSNFRINTAMSNFLRLEDAAEFYDLTFRHWERARDLLPLDVHVVAYERLVDDVAAEVRPLFDFLGLEWHADALDHTRTARQRGLITTASYAQVTEPIYKRAAGRWERYRRHLEPILPVLAPWVDKFGYSL